MKKMNMFLVVGACLLFAGNASAMQLRSGVAVGAEEDSGEAAMPDVEAEALEALLAAEATAAADTAATPASTEAQAASAPAVTPAGWRIVSWFKALSPSNVRAYLAAQWAKVPSKAAFETWHANMKAKRSFRMMVNALGAAVVAVLAYQAWIYAHAQCAAEGRAAEVMCGGAQAVDNFFACVTMLASTALEDVKQRLHDQQQV